MATPPIQLTDSLLVNTMREIESKTEKLVITSLKTGNLQIGMTNREISSSPSSPTLHDIIQSGSSEFERKIGRPMTYFEMRSMFG